MICRLAPSLLCWAMVLLCSPASPSAELNARPPSAVNAVVDVLLGERYRLQYLLPGLALVAAGLVLCTLQ